MKRGLPSFIYREIEGLEEQGFHIILFVTKYGQGLYMPKDSWPIYRINPFGILFAQLLFLLQSPLKYLGLLLFSIRTNTSVDFTIAPYFAYVAKKEQITSIHCKEGLHSLGIGYYLHKILELPLSVMIYADALYTFLNRDFFIMALQACCLILTVCEFNKKMLISEFGVLEEKIKVVYIHVDSINFQPDRRTVILITGQFAERKGHEVLFNAIKHLNRKDIVVWVVGGKMIGGETRLIDVEGIVKSLAIEDQVIFWGNVSEEMLKALYQRCDIFCLPSRFRGVREGTPVALMEAMACERPIISTRHAGIPEYVQDALVEEDDVEGLANAILYLVDHPEIRKQQGALNRAIVLEKFSKENLKKLAMALETKSEHE
jgi:glycosyltransferase involved in cell wall biosynthesis